MQVNSIDRIFKKAARSTVNKLLRRGRTLMSKQVRQVYNIKAGDLKKYTKMHRATNANAAGAIVISGNPMPLILFGAKQNRRGTSVRVKKTTGRRTIGGAFIATMPSGKIQVWMRHGPGRLPIRQLLTVSPPKMYEREGEKHFQSLVEKDAAKTLRHELEFFAGRN